MHSEGPSPVHSTRGVGLLFLSHSLFLLAFLIGIHRYAKLKLESFVLCRLYISFQYYMPMSCRMSWNNKKMMSMVAYSEMPGIPSPLTCTSTYFPHYILGYFILLFFNLDGPNWLAWLIEWGGNKVLKLQKLGHRKSYSFCLDSLECTFLEHCAGTLGFHIKDQLLWDYHSGKGTGDHLDKQFWLSPGSLSVVTVKVLDM